MFTAFIYTYVLATVAQTNFLNHILNRQPATESATGSINRQLVGNCPSNPLKTSIGHLSFSKVSMLCSQPSFILTLKLLSFRLMFYISVRIGN